MNEAIYIILMGSTVEDLEPNVFDEYYLSKKDALAKAESLAVDGAYDWGEEVMVQRTIDAKNKHVGFAVNSYYDDDQLETYIVKTVNK